MQQTLHNTSSAFDSEHARRPPDATSPTFPSPLHVGRPNIGSKERLLERMSQIVESRWLTNAGPFVKEFEQAVAARTGVKHCIAMCNATIALEIAIRALGLNGEVIVPSFTFIATAHALQWQQITPVFCDVAPGSHNIDPGRIEDLITPRTTGILPVHTWGHPCDVHSLQAIADRHNLKIIYDAAHAFGCGHQGKPIGGFGNAEVFSFHATKFLNTFEGGMVATNDDELAHRIRLMTNFGFSGYDHVVYIGTNGKMNEASAAMGLTNLESVDDFIACNKRNYQAYLSALQQIPGIKLIRYNEADDNNYQYVVLEIDRPVFGLTRDQLLSILWKENVYARRYFFPGCHRMQPYRSFFPHAGLLLPNTERLVERVLLLPSGTAISLAEVGTICDIIQQSHRDHEGLSKLLPPTLPPGAIPGFGR